MSGDPYPLETNQDKSFQGSVVVGIGFVLEPQEAKALMEKDPRNKDVLFPYLNGQDLNYNPDQTPSRWVINFFDWPLERGRRGSWEEASKGQRRAWKRSGEVPVDYPHPVAADYPDCLKIVRERVKPERDAVRRKAHRKYWWHYGDKRPALYQAIVPMQRILVTPRVSKYLNLVLVPVGMVYSEQVVVFTLDSYASFAYLQSSIHEMWTRGYASTFGQGLRYTPRDVLDNYAFVDPDKIVEDIGNIYYVHRHQIMLDRQEGLTDTYNRFHDPEESAADIARLRELHMEMDRAVAAAYGWEDLALGHGFHETQQGVRFTIDQDVRWEVLDRLLELNHARHEEEVREAAREKGNGGKRKQEVDERQLGLF
jgi:hypothetical protein